ncbi:MAG: ABC transporter permease [Acidobacteria bacterium]|nr:ABC transporter permease [Acidobacteriota bacterium]
MRSPLRTPFGAIFQTEVLLNSKRVAPYAMAGVFSANAWLWCAKGAAVHYGWAINSDFYITRILGGFSFMTMPLFIALMMGDPVVRDYRSGINPLIFSKPVSRAEYLLGKFFGNFFVLICCLACFALTACLLQAFGASGMVVLPARVAPYFTNFIMFVGVSSLTLAAVCFTVGTLTRNVKIVYGLMTAFYPLYISWQLAMKGLPTRWRVILDPLLMNWQGQIQNGRSADWLNQLALSYDADLIANRALMLGAPAVCMAILYARFSMVEQSKKVRGGHQLTTIGLGTRDERLQRGEESFGSAYPTSEVEEAAPAKTIVLPQVVTVTEGARAGFRQLRAASGVELRLLFAERSLVVLLPLAMLSSVIGLAYFEAVPEPSYSAAYAGRTADSFLLFLLAIAIFYTGEAMHRDRELRIEPVLWAVPAPNFVLLLSKFSTTLLLSLFAGILVGAAAVALQIYKGHAPIEVTAYLTVYFVILIPSAAFVIAAATALNVLLRDKYLAYAASLAIAGVLFYLFNLGYNHPLYNPLLYSLWTPSDFTSGAGRLPQILTHRIYCLMLAALCLSLAHLFFERKATKGLPAGARLSGKGWTLLIATLATAAAIITALMINSGRGLGR